MVTGITILTDLLLPSEKILWHRLPIPRKPKEGEGKFIPLLTGAILIIFISPLVIHSLISRTTQTASFILFIILLLIGIGLIAIGIFPVLTYNKSKDNEYLITNQRVLIYPIPYTKEPKIINLYEINGEIAMKYNQHNNTGSIYIPTPHWNRIANVQSSMEVFGRAIIDPDIRGIKDPHKVYDILVDAIARGKTLNWKFDKD